MSIDQHTTPREIVSGLLWTWILAALVLTAALIVVGGAFVLASATVRIVLGALVVVAGVHLLRQHRHRHELDQDPRLRRLRERRGF
jgi:membrane protein implicated in regulation of membrane protease activity